MDDDARDHAIEELLRHREWAVRLARRLVRDAHRADDVVQQAYLAAMRNPPTCLRSPRAWLGQVVRSWAARGARSQGRRERHELAAGPSEGAESTFDAVARADLRRLLVNAVLDLGEPYRTTLLLRYFEGWSLDAIAAETKAPIETVRTRLRRGLRELRERLGKRGRDGGHRAEPGAYVVLLAERTPPPVSPATARNAARPTVSRAAAARLVGAVTIVAAVVVAAVMATAIAAGGGGAAAAYGPERADAAPPTASAMSSVGPITTTPPVEAHRDESSQSSHGTAVGAPRVRRDATPFGSAAPFAEHAALVNAIVFLPAGDLIAAGTSDGDISIRQTADGAVRRVLRGGGGSVSSLALTQDGTRLLAGSADHVIRSWDLARDDAPHEIRVHDAPVREIACGPGGLAVSSDTAGGLVVWRTQDDAVVARRRDAAGPGRYFRSLAFAADGRTLLAATTTCDSLHRLSVADLTPADAPGDGAGLGRVCRVDARGIAWTSAGADVVALGDMPSRAACGSEITALETMKGGSEVVAIAGTRDGTVAGIGRAGGAPVWTLSLPGRAVMAIAVRADGRLAAWACNRGTLGLFDPASGRATDVPRPESAGHSGAVASLAASADGAVVVSGGWDGAVIVWDAWGRPRHTIRAHNERVIGVDVSPDGSVIASASEDHTARTWHAGTGAPLAVLRGHRDTVGAVRIDADGRRVLTGSQDGDARLWDAATGDVLRTFRGHTDEVRGVAFLGDGRVATASEDATVRIWDVTTGVCATVLRGHEGRVTAVTAHGATGALRIVSAGHDGTVRVWDPGGGPPLATLRGHCGWVHDVALSADGRTIASAGDDGTVRRWDLASGAPLDILSAHTAAVDAVVFVTNPSRLLTGGWDKRIFAWEPADGTR